MSGFLYLFAFLGIFLGTMFALIHWLGFFGGFVATMALLTVYLLGQHSARADKRSHDGGRDVFLNTEQSGGYGEYGGDGGDCGGSDGGGGCGGD